MNLNKMAATAAMAGALGSAALGIGAGLAQADPDGPNMPGPVPGPNVPGQGQVPPGQVPGPGPGQVPGVACNDPVGANCNGPGLPLPPGQRGAPPPGHYNEPTRYGLPATWDNPPDLPAGKYPIVYNPDVDGGQWGVQASNGFHVYTPAGGANGSGNVGGNVGNPGT